MEKIVSVVIPIYNMGDKIAKCVKSIQNQSYRNIEIILVDDGSTDNTFDECIKIKKNDTRIKIFHQENCGSGPARNNGIINAIGEYIYFPDADDYIEPETIKKLVDIAEKSNSDLIVFGYKIEGNKKNIKKYENKTYDGNYIRNNYYSFYNMEQPFSIQGAPWNKFFKTEIIKDNDLMFPPLRRHQDEAFIAKYVNHVRQVTFISDVLYTYFANDLKKEWDKYPIDYIDAVNGLFDERKGNILRWNENDIKTHNQVYKEYICNFTKALELSFSPKFKFKYKSRIDWLKNSIMKFKINKYLNCKKLKSYHKIAYFCIRHKLIHVLYFLLLVRVEVRQYI